MEEKIEKIKKFIVEKLNPDKIILFGSRAKNKNKKFSDIDICVTAQKPDHRSLRKLKEEMDDILGIYSYDLVFWNDLEESFKKIIKETGEIIYVKNGSNAFDRKIKKSSQ